ncbi:response regulator transcription factor [Streptomyces sp. PA03-2a]|uniref:response regulator transcription factor n=1 Tax=Streptomyces sp. PA03-2a TaxID=3028701 RepID=UPI0029AC7849|nr:response regulator transcription factor [Streptomyces sp. PA03-2a]MDX2730265.1 response regulator transcription factor [Streptomyces sp. PA03-2a]
MREAYDMITVLLADDDPAARQGLRTIIDSSPDARVVAEAWDGRSAVDQARRLLPDVVVMDVRMPGTDGIAATRQLRKLPTPPAVLILTTFGLEEYVEQALKAGASGFLIKDTPPAELLSALRGLAEGHAVFAPEVTGQVIDLTTGEVQAPADSRYTELVAALTERQVEVLRLLALGLSNANIATELGMTEGTVKGHVTQLLARLGVTNRVAAARIAYRAGFSAEDV